MRLHHNAFDMSLDQVAIAYGDRWLRLGCCREVSAEAIEHERLDLGAGSRATLPASAFLFCRTAWGT